MRPVYEPDESAWENIFEAEALNEQSRQYTTLEATVITSWWCIQVGSYFEIRIVLLYRQRSLRQKRFSFPFNNTHPPNTTSILFQIHRYWVRLISLTDELCTYILYDLYSCIYSPLTHCRFFQNYLWSEQEVGMSVSNGGLCFFLSYQEQIVVDVTLTMPLASCLVFPNAVPPGTHMRLRKMKRGQSIRTH